MAGDERFLLDISVPHGLVRPTIPGTKNARQRRNVMSLKEQLMQDMKTAMKAKDQTKVNIFIDYQICIMPGFLIEF